MQTAKAAGAAIGGGVGEAAARIGIWITETAAAIDIPPEVELAIGVCVTAAIAWIGAYIAPRNAP